jgi:VIT1/CCC1 family predicted Fe2+/Mn2+ transporter
MELNKINAVQEQNENLFHEKDRIGKLGRIRQFIFGTLDGLLVPVGVISAVAGGTGNSKTVIIAGLAEAFAGALSMGAGEFISGRSEAQVQKTEIAKELKEMKDEPEREAMEMVALFENEGIAHDDAVQMTAILKKYENAYQRTMVEKELGLKLNPDTVKIAEFLTMGISYSIGSIFPLVAYFFLPVSSALPLSLTLTVLALILVGIVKGKLAKLNMFRSIIEIVGVGVVSAGGGYFLGTVLPKMLGF